MTQDKKEGFFPLQDRFPLPEWCRRRLQEGDTYQGKQVLFLLPLQVPAEMRTEQVACVSIVTADNLLLVGPNGVVVGGAVYLRDDEGLFYQHSHGYNDRATGLSSYHANNKYLRTVVGLD